MLRWAILGFSAFVCLLIWYWYNPDFFKIKPERKYPENYSKHPDPYQYKK